MAPDGASPDAVDGARPEDPATTPPPGFFEELADSFARHRPQGSLTWNLSAALGLLQKAFPGTRTPAADPSGAGPTRRLDLAGATARLRRGRDARPPGAARPEWTPGQDIPEAPEGAEVRYEAALRTMLDALIFVSARLDELETDRRRRDEPLDGPAQLAPAHDVGPWGPAVLAHLGATSGPVLHTECGEGGLLDALATAGLDARGVEPRGDLAWEAARRGHPVGVGDPLERLGALAPRSLGALVLSGIVDRAPLTGLLGLLDGAVGRLGPRAPVVVIGAGADHRGPPAARDLLPGRALHRETWVVLLERAGFAEVAPLEGGPGGPGFAVAARAPGDGA